MNTSLQFKQTMETQNDKTAQALLHSDLSGISNQNVAESADLKPRPGSSAEYYLYGRNLIRAADEKPDWQQTLVGRIGTRLISRGIFGALAFTWMGNYAGRALKNYDPSCIKTWGEFGQALTNVSSTSLHYHQAKPNIMCAIAKSFDVLAGKPIQAAARSIAPSGYERLWEKSAVTFRPRAMFHDPISKLHKDGDYVLRQYGRTLGHEVVAVTADFAAASTADAAFRNIIQAIDPNTDKDREKNPNAEFDWYKKGKFHLGSFSKDVGKRLWKIVSFNQGEDWAVALPYVYFMKWHRNAINNISPGFKIASDNPNWNVSSDKWRRSTLPNSREVKLEHIGDFGKEGAWDLQARFSIYNVFTLMYREAYTKAGDFLGDVWHGGKHQATFTMPENPFAAAVKSVGNIARYGLKSFIKANIYMQPAVPFFWSFRVPQSRWRASPIIVEGVGERGSTRIPSLKPNSPESVHGAFYNDKPGDISNTSWNNLVDQHKERADISASHIGWHRNNDTRVHPGRESNYSGPVYIGETKVVDHPQYNRKPYDQKNIKTSFSSFFNPFGKASYTTGSTLWNAVDSQSSKGKTWVMNTAAALTGTQIRDRNGNLRINTDTESFKFHAQNGIRGFVDASFSYTPYMIAKAETARRWDNKQMDEAIYEGIDGALSFNLSKVKKSLSSIGELLIRPPQTIQDPITGGVKSQTAPMSVINAQTAERSSILLPAHRTIQ